MKISNITAYSDSARTIRAIDSRIETILFHKKFYGKAVERGVIYEHIRMMRRWRARLVLNSHIRTGHYTSFIKLWGDTRTHMNKLFPSYVEREKVYDHNNPEDRAMKSFYDHYAYIGKKGRIAEYQYQIQIEMQLAKLMDKYIVFDTLTVPEELIAKVFVKKSQLWDSYLKRWQRNCTNHRYFAVVEKGGKNGHLHIHVLHLFQDCKFRLSDPNFYRTVPNYREITEFKKFWPHGFSSPIAVRLNTADRWALEGHKWPVEKKGNKYVPIKTNPPKALAFYMTKYLTKTFNTKGSEKWRVRKTQKFGRQEIEKVTKEIPLYIRLKILQNPLQIIKIAKSNGRKIPLMMMTKEMTRQSILLMEKRFPKRMKNVYLRMDKAESLWSRIMFGTETTQEYKQQNSLNIRTRSLTNKDISKITDVIVNCKYIFNDDYEVTYAGTSADNSR